MMKNKIFFLSLLLIIGCNKKIEQKNSTPKNIEVNTEDFNTFFEKFQKDSIFQKERIVFPLKVRVFNTDNLKTEENRIEKNDYEFFKIDENEVSIEKKISKDSANVNFKGKDNGIFIETKFLKIEGVWKLISFNDQST